MVSLALGVPGRHNALPFPSSPSGYARARADPYLALGRHGLGRLAQDRGDATAAKTYYREAIAIGEKVLRPESSLSHPVPRGPGQGTSGPSARIVTHDTVGRGDHAPMSRSTRRLKVPREVTVSGP